MKLYPWQAAIVSLTATLSVALADPTPLEVGPKSHAVLASAVVQADPAQVTLQWPPDQNATNYMVLRKRIDGAAWFLLGTLDGTATNVTDHAVSANSAYEYQIIKGTPNYSGYGYIRVGIQAPLVDQRGKIILLVAQTYAAELRAELEQLQQDLVGDGWTVLRHEVSSEDPVTTVKALVQTDYNSDPANVQALFLFGRVPVPYSGNLAPDGHTNHFGAWPADVYYADLHGVWTDSSVTSTNAERERNWNVPGDGKFDQSAPSRVDLQLGRVDLSNMTSFSNKTPSRSEKDLLRQYLMKDHRFRHNQLAVESRALICDNFFDKGDDPVGAGAWRNFSAFFGADGITEVGWSNYFPAVTTGSYLWTFASGGGQYYTSTGVGSSDDFALQDVQAVFTMWLGSYFGDWDNESNFLRAPLGSSSYTLTSVYSGFPQWLFHPMALGQTAGYCARLTQNNGTNGLYAPFNPGAGKVHITLLGDPTLRMHPVSPPTGLAASLSSRGVRLAWTPSADTNVVGYHVYRSGAASGPFARLTGSTPVAVTNYVDSPAAGAYTYMVRAVKLQLSSSGSYWNASQGAFSVPITAAGTGPGPTSATLAIARGPAGQVELQLSGQPGQSILLQASPDFRNWTNLAVQQLIGGTVELTDPLLPDIPRRFYRVQ